MRIEQNFWMRSVSFWDRYAPWYDLWIRHNSFHKPIIELLYKLVEPNWTVLDIGAGNGVLSIPLHQIGCQVTAIEPSMGMRDLMYSELIKRGIQDFNIDSRRWEDIPTLYYSNYDLVIASNSLHLMDIPFETALNKVFATRPKTFLLVTELDRVRDQIFYDPNRYELKLCRAYYADTSFAYHNIKEVYEHYQLRCCRMLTESEKREIINSLVLENRHFWKKEEALVGIYYWVRKDERV